MKVLTPSKYCHTATVRPKTVSNLSTPGSTALLAEKTLNVPPVPVVIVLVSIASLKKATTGCCGFTPIVLFSGATLTEGMPSATPRFGGNCPVRQPRRPALTRSVMFWSEMPRQDVMGPVRRG